jgi:hypothetical protein
VLLGVGFLALMTAFGHESVVVQEGEDMALATYLADEIHAMAAQMPLADAIAYLDGYTYSPAVLSTGTYQDLTGWSQVVDVTPVSASDLTAEVGAADAQAARLTVEVRHHGEPAVTQVYYLFDLSSLPYTEPE